MMEATRHTADATRKRLRMLYCSAFGVALTAITACIAVPAGETTNVYDPDLAGNWAANVGHLAGLLEALAVFLLPSILLTILVNLPPG